MPIMRGKPRVDRRSTHPGKGVPMSESTSNQTTGRQSSGLAIAGLVLGIIAAVTSFLPIINNISFFIGIIGGVFALVALVGALRGKHDAKGLSIAGVVLAVVSCAIVLASQSAYKAALDKAVDKATSGSKPVATSTESDSGDDAIAEATKENKAKGKSGKKAAGDTSPTESDATADDKDYSSLAVGETVTLEDGLSVTVNSVKTGLANYDDSLVTCINVTYANNGSGNESFSSYDWKGEDANGAQRNIAYYSESTDELDTGTLSAGGTVTGNIYFEDGITRVLYYSNMFNTSATAGWTL